MNANSTVNAHTGRCGAHSGGRAATASVETTALRPVRRSSIADAIYDELRDEIIARKLEPGAPLPGERALSERFGANRGAVREALKRLESAGLVAIHQGGPTRVLDFELTAGLDFVTELMFSADGGVDESVVRSMAELTTLITPAIARCAAATRCPALDRPLRECVASLERSIDDPARLHEVAEEYWALLARHGGNVAYQLILNTVREVSDAHGGLDDDFFGTGSARSQRRRAVRMLKGIAEAVLAGDATGAEQAVRRWITASVAERRTGTLTPPASTEAAAAPRIATA